MMIRCNYLPSARLLVSKKASSITSASASAATAAAAPLRPNHPLFPLNGRLFSTYKFNCLIEWMEHEDGGKSLLVTPPPLASTRPLETTYQHQGLFRDPRSRMDRSFGYTDLTYQGDERKQMLETAAIKWIGGALNGLNTANGKIEAYVVVGGSGTGKTRFLGEIVKQWDHWRDLSAARAKADPKKPSREIPPDTLVFSIGFNNLSSVGSKEVKIIQYLREAKKKDDCKYIIEALATTRCLYACYDVKQLVKKGSSRGLNEGSFSDLINKIINSLVNKSLNPSALSFTNFHSGIREKYYDGYAVPFVILIDEVSKIGDEYINHFIPAMNRNMDNKLAIVWTARSEGKFEQAEAVPAQRCINKLFLPALSPADSLTMLKDKHVNNEDNTEKLKEILGGSLYLCWNKSSDRVLVDWDDVLVMLSEAAGGLPRGVEKMYIEIKEMGSRAGSLTNESMPLLNLLDKVSMQISSSYSFAENTWENSLYLAVFRAFFPRTEKLNLNPKLVSAQRAEEAICGGCLIDARGSGNPADEYSDIQPIMPAIFPGTWQILKDSLKNSSFTPTAMETYVADWLVLWFAARQACLYGTSTNKKIMEELNITPQALWRPFSPFLDVNNKDDYSILYDLDHKCVLEKNFFSDIPLYSSNNPGIFQPEVPDYKGLDAIVVIPSKSGRPEDSVLIAIEAKTSLLERANTNVYNKLPSQYKSTVELLSKAGWTPGVNAFYYVMSKGQLDDANKKKRLLKTCPHMRVLAGEELKAAMGPTIYWGFKHLRILGTVYLEKQPNHLNKRGKRGKRGKLSI